MNVFDNKIKKEGVRHLPFCGVDGGAIEQLIPILMFIDKLVKKS